VERCRRPMSHWILKIGEGVKASAFSTPIRSGEIVVVGSNPMRVVGSRANSHFGNSWIGATSDFGVESRELPIHEPRKDMDCQIRGGSQSSISSKAKFQN
jgi:hypothetical protein